MRVGRGRTLASFVAFAGGALWTLSVGAQQAAPAVGKDVPGWEAAKWGMTEAEVTTALAGKAKALKDTKTRQVWDKPLRFALGYKTSFGGVKGRVELGFSPEGRLACVQFYPEGLWEEFLALEKHLIAEYGPRERVANPLGSVPLRIDIEWPLPSATVHLLRLGAREPRYIAGLVLTLTATNAAKP